MATETNNAAGAALRTLFEAGTAVGRSDRELLDRFLASGGPAAELAFAALVERHGPMVWRICRGTLREPHDADDAFQATFLTLVRRADAIRERASLGPWLHGVALRVARSARRSARRRQARERERVGVVTSPGSGSETSTDRVDHRDEAAILHAEVDRLPARYRDPLVLCYFHGLTHDEAARQLGWPVGTVRSRLAAARDRLRPRLVRRGVAPAVAIAAASGRAGAFGVPPHLAAATVRMAIGAGAAGAVPASVAALVGTTLRGILLVKTSIIAAGVLAATLVSLAGPGYLPGATRGAMASPAGPDDRPPGTAVRTVGPTTVTVTEQYPAQILARQHIDIRSSQDGTLAAIPVREGQAVKAGDPLFEIIVPRLRAKLAAEMTESILASEELDRTLKLAEQKAVADSEVQVALAKLGKAQTQADLTRAELDAANPRAPFDGTVGRLSVEGGRFVKQGDPLATLSDTAVMWVYFKVPEDRPLDSGAAGRQSQERPAIELTVADQPAFPHPAKLEDRPITNLTAADLRKFPHPGKLDPDEAHSRHLDGVIVYRADFPNPDGTLRHGQKGTVAIRRVLKDALVVPTEATFEEGGKRYLLRVGDDRVARRREVTVRAEVDGGLVVGAGVQPGDRIVGEGVGKVRDGDRVDD